MAKVTARENFMKLLRCETPYYIPYYTMFNEEYKGEAPLKSMRPEFYPSTQFKDGGTDMWGIPYKGTAEAGGATMPDTTVITLHDIADWRKVLKFPKLNEYDWKLKAQKDFEAIKADRTQSVIMMGCPGMGMFQSLVGLMGFEGGLCALYTDPDEVKEMFNAMLEETLLPAIDIMFDYYDFDCFGMGDDTCAKQVPFFSPEGYEDVFLPVYDRLAKRAQERGMPIDFHNCGRIDEFLPFMEKFGVKITNPVQETNDIPALEKEYKGRMSFAGGWDWDFHMPPEYPEFDDEYIREGVRHSIDTYGKEGNYCFCGGVTGKIGEEAAMRVNMIIRDEVYHYGKKVYGYPVPEE